MPCQTSPASELAYADYARQCLGDRQISNRLETTSMKLKSYLPVGVGARECGGSKFRRTRGRERSSIGKSLSPLKSCLHKRMQA